MARANFAGRLRRMLMMVPWLLETGGSTVEELAARFGVSEEDVVRDLNLVMCCGVPPYGAEHMISVMLDDDGSVHAWKGPFFTRPMRLTPTEGFAVLTAGRALLAVPGAASDALEGALAKLESALGSGSVDVELDAPPLLSLVRDAVAARSTLRVTYYSAWRDEITERDIDPWLVFSQEGRWYVTSLDARSGQVRHFRVDRLESASTTGEQFTPPGEVRPPAQVFSGGPDTTEVVVELPSSGRWVVETYSAHSTEELDDGRLRVRLSVTGERWLERLLLRVGPEARVLEPAAFAAVAPGAARRLLSRYASVAR